MSLNASGNCDVIGLVPAAGEGHRLGAIPCSKEVYPLEVRSGTGERSPVKVATHYVLGQMGRAGIERSVICIRRGKWDIPAYLGTGQESGPSLAYVVVAQAISLPYTLFQAVPFVREMAVALGLPDIILEDDDTYVALLDRLRASGAQVVLGLFEVDDPAKRDMVDVDGDGRVHTIHQNPVDSMTRWCWLAAVWTSTFTDFLARHVISSMSHRESTAGGVIDAPLFAASAKEPQLGAVFQAAVDAGRQVEAVTFPQRGFMDVGTPEDLRKTLSCLSDDTAAK